MAFNKSMGIEVVEDGSNKIIGDNRTLTIRSTSGGVELEVNKTEQAIVLDPHQALHLLSLLAQATEHHLDAW